MNNKKKVLIVIILFIFLGLTIFTFANPADKQIKEQGSGTSEKDSKKEEQPKEDQKDNDNAVNNNVNDQVNEHGVNRDALTLNQTLNDNTTNDNTTNDNTDEKEEASSGDTEKDDTYEKALAAVIVAEKELQSGSYKSALELVNVVKDSGKQTELSNRLAEVKNAIDVKELVSTLYAKTTGAANKAEMDGARDYRTVEEIVNRVSSLANETLKGELKDTLEELSKLLDDADLPEFDVKSGTHSTDTMTIKIEDLTLDYIEIYNQDTKTTEIVTESEITLTDEATYRVTAYDKNGNKSTVWVAIDKTNPTIKVEGTGADNYFRKDVTVTVEDKFLTTVEVNGEKQEGIETTGTNNEGKTLVKVFTEEGTYTVVATDKVGNKETVTFTIDKTMPKITGVENGKYYNTDVTPVIDEANLRNAKITKDGGKAVDFVSGTTLTEEGTYYIKVTDMAYNKKAEVTFTIDKTLNSPSVVEILGLNAFNKNTEYVKNGKTVRIFLTFDEELSSERNGNWGTYFGTFTINGEQSPLRKHQYDEENKKFEYLASYTIPEDAKISDGELAFEVSVFGDHLRNTINPITSTVNARNGRTKVIYDGTEPKFNFENGKMASEFTVEVTDNNFEYMTVTNMKTGKTETITESTYKLPSENADNLRYDIVAYDKAGNQTKKTNIYLDNTNPVFEVTGVVSGKQTEFVDGGIYQKVTLKVTDGSLKKVTNGSEVLAELDNNYNTNKVMSYGNTFEKDGTYTITATDRNGNVSEVTFTIDTKAPVINGLPESGFTDKDFTIDVEDTNLDKITISKRGSDEVLTVENGYVMSEEGSYIIEVTDKAGNKERVNLGIDKTAPVVTGVEDGAYYNTSVTPVVTDLQLAGAIRLNGEKYTSGTEITEEGTYTLVATDRVGHTTTVTFTIDKTAPVASALSIVGGSFYKENNVVTYYPKANENVYVYVTFGEKLDKKPTLKIDGKEYEMSIEHDNKDGSYKYYTKAVLAKDLEEGLVEFEVYGYQDKAGNEGKKLTNADITLPAQSRVVIDKTAPQVEKVQVWNALNSDSNYVKNGGIVRVLATFKEKLGELPTLTIGSKSELMQPIAGGNGEIIYSAYITIPEDESELTEGTLEFTISGYKDLSGNIGSDVINTSASKNLTYDRTAPVMTVKDNTSTVEGSIGTDGHYSVLSLKLHDNFDLDYALVNGVKYERHNVWNDLNFVNVNNYVEGENTVVLVDRAGNESTFTFIYDTTAPTGIISYSTLDPTNRSVTVTLTADEEVEILNAGTWNKTGFNTEFKKVYYANATQNVTIRDKAGNENVITVDIKNIDKVAPTGIISYSTLDPTNGSVTVTLTTDEEVEILNAGTWNKTGFNTEFKKVYYANATQNVTIRDKAGNENVVTVDIKNIDKVAPTAEVTVSEHNNDGKWVTFKFNEPIDESILPQGMDKVPGEENTYKKVYYKSGTLAVKDVVGNEAKIDFEI